MKLLKLMKLFEVGVESMEKFPSLMSLVKDDLCRLATKNCFQYYFFFKQPSYHLFFMLISLETVRLTDDTYLLFIQ